MSCVMVVAIQYVLSTIIKIHVMLNFTLIKDTLLVAVIMYQSTDVKSKNEDILRYIVQVVSSSCGCAFIFDHLTDSVFLCSSSSPNSVTYQAQLHGTLQTNVYQLADIIHEEFYTKRKAIRIQSSLLPVVGFCLVPPNIITPCDNQITSTEEMSVSTSSTSETSSLEDTTAANYVVVVGVSVAIAVVVIVFLLIGVILCLHVIRKQKDKTKGSDNAE